MTATATNLLNEPEAPKFNALAVEERNALVLSCERLCASIARQAVRGARGIDVDDLTQEALVACVEASQRWDPTREVKFSTYATKCVRRHVIKLVVAHRSKGEVQCEDWERVPGRSAEAGEDDRGQELTEEQEAALARLPETSELAVRLVLLDGLNPAAVAEQFGLSVKDLKLILRNAAGQLRRDLAFLRRPALFDSCGVPNDEAA